MNQSELEANACNRRQARENTYDRDMIGFGLVSHWLILILNPTLHRAEIKLASMKLSANTVPKIFGDEAGIFQ